MSSHFADFQKLLGYNFTKQNLLQEALTHKSYSVDENINCANNEKLEFLGDSILNFIIAEKLLRLFPSEQEGVLSKKRAALVNHTKLAEVAKKFKLDQFMFFGPGEVKQGNHLNGRLQGSCIEALIGAIYLDSDVASVREWILAQFSESDFAVQIDASFSSDYKSRLQEFTQSHKLGTPSYEVLLTAGPAHKPSFLISLKLNNIEKCRAEGSSKKIAEQNAAEIFLKELLKSNKDTHEL